MVDTYRANIRMGIMFPGIVEENRAKATLSTSELALFYRQRALRESFNEDDGEVIATITYKKDNILLRVNDYIADAIIRAIDKIPYRE